MSGGNSDVKLIVDGKRLDGRGLNELRPLKIEAGVLKRADGSCYLEWGKNKVIAAVYGPRECLPKHFQDPYKARLLYRYNMAPFSVEERKRPGPDRRSVEISKISRQALEKVVFLEFFPRASIDVFVEVLQADAGTRCAGLTAASVALADAGIPMRELIVSCAAGKINDKIVVDLCKEEDNFGQADLPVAILPRSKEIVLMQLDGILTKEEFGKARAMAISGCLEAHEKQKEALKTRYEAVKETAEE
jgi:exosome complex component RRP41